MAEISPNARAVLDHLQTDPYGNHTTRTVAAATGLAWQQVQSVFTLLTQIGWAVYRDGGGKSRPLTLTSNGRSGAYIAVDGGEVDVPMPRPSPEGAGTPLTQLDREDPRMADVVRARMGWPLRHAS